MVKVALIGVSGFAEVHYNNLVEFQNDGKLEIVAATVINQAEEVVKCDNLKNLGCQIFKDYQEMLSSFKNKIDICFIPTGISLHAPMAIAAMQSGANCIIEKPAAATIEDVIAMRKVSKETQKFIAVGFQTIYVPEIQQAKKIIVDQKLGLLKRVKVLGLWPRDYKYYSRNNWAGKIKDVRGDWVLDSPFNNALAHYLNVACFFAGKTEHTTADIKSVQATLCRINPEIENADTASIKVITKSDIEILFHTTHASEEAFGPNIVIECENGTISTDMSTITIKKNNEEDQVLTIDQSLQRKNIINALIQRVSDSEAFVCGLDIATAHTLAVNGAQKSSKIIVADQNDIEKLNIDNDNYRYICKDLDKVLHKCFETNTMLNSEHYPWLSVGDIVSMENYTKFEINCT